MTSHQIRERIEFYAVKNAFLLYNRKSLMMIDGSLFRILRLSGRQAGRGQSRQSRWIPIHTGLHSISVLIFFNQTGTKVTSRPSYMKYYDSTNLKCEPQYFWIKRRGYSDREGLQLPLACYVLRMPPAVKSTLYIRIVSYRES